MRNQTDVEFDQMLFDPIDWPDAEIEVDDEDFARAIAEGRGKELAA